MKKPKINLEKITHHINVSKHVCNHLLGEQHSLKHRRVAGVVVMIVGVFISKGFPEIAVLHFIMDTSGYFIHALGAIPWIESINHNSKK